MTLEELEERVRTLEDIEEIKKLQARYANSLINTRWDDVVDCFAEDGVADLHMGRATGKDELTRLFRDKISMTHRGLEGLFVVHPEITAERDRAKGNWLLYIQFSLPRKLDPKPDILLNDDAPDWMQGYYDMEYRKDGGKWKISSLKWRVRLISPRTLLK
jgi:hypothetical protein